MIRWSDEDEVFVVSLPEFDDAKTHDETYEKAARQGRLLIESFMMWYEQAGKDLPQPQTFQLEQVA